MDELIQARREQRQELSQLTEAVHNCMGYAYGEDLYQIRALTLELEQKQQNENRPC